MNRRLVIAHPSPDLYGSDRQLLRSIEAARADEWDVLLVLPRPGPLVELAQDSGAAVRVVGARRLLRETGADLLYVNTVTIPWWLLAGRLAGTPSLSHVHEAEPDQHRVIALTLNAPLALAREIVANSGAAAEVITDAVPRLASRVTVVHNGVPGPEQPPTPREHTAGAPWHLAVIGRLSPRKGIDVALEAVAELVRRGHDVTLSVCGTVFPGYEWYEDELRRRADAPDLAGRVRLQGYVHPTWNELAACDVVLVPSRTEPFGNTAVEGLLARRPVVASRVQGLIEVIRDDETGLLVEPGDPVALADGIERLLRDDVLRAAVATRGEADAHERFGTALYERRIADLLAAALRTP